MIGQKVQTLDKPRTKMNPHALVILGVAAAAVVACITSTKGGQQL